MPRRRHALILGINTYPGFGPESQLTGAVCDAQTITDVLVERHGFASDDILRLFEAQATRRGILDALETLQHRAGQDEEVLIYFSGHGSQMTDREQDEGDGLDETLVPFDSGRSDAENRDITDDEINHWAAGLLEVTPNLTLIFDCCHAATLQRPLWPVRSVPPDLRPVDALPPSPVPVWRDVEIGPRPLMLAACRDDEQALELPSAIAGEARGAFSFHLIEAFHQAVPGTSWREIFDRSAAALEDNCPDQHPMASGDGLDTLIFGGHRATKRRVDPGQRLLELASRPSRFQLSMKLFRSRGGAWREVKEASFIEGDRLRVDLRHGHDHELFVYLFDIGVTGVVTLLFPDSDGHELLDPGAVLTVGARRGDRLDMFLPTKVSDDFSSGIGHLLFVAARSRISWMRSSRPTTESFALACHGVTKRFYRLRRI